MRIPVIKSRIEQPERCKECGTPIAQIGLYDDANYLNNGDGPYCDKCAHTKQEAED